MRGPFGVRLGSVWGPFGVRFGSVLGPFWVRLGSVLGPFGVHLGIHLGSIWDRLLQGPAGFASILDRKVERILTQI